MIKNPYCKSIKAGDLILVNYPSGLWPAVYKKEGQNNNPQFYILGEDRLDFFINNPERKVYTDYIIRDFSHIVKPNPADVDDEVVRLYIKTLKLLKDRNLIP